MHRRERAFGRHERSCVFQGLARRRLAELERVSKFSFNTPHDPPCPEQRSMTAILVSGRRRAAAGKNGCWL